MNQPREILDAAIKHNRSLYRVAQLMGVRYQTAHNWKTGRSAPQARHLLKLIKLAGKSVKTLAGVSLISIALPFTYADHANAANHSYVRGPTYTLCAYTIGSEL